MGSGRPMVQIGKYSCDPWHYVMDLVIGIPIKVKTFCHETVQQPATFEIHFGDWYDVECEACLRAVEAIEGAPATEGRDG